MSTTGSPLASGPASDYRFDTVMFDDNYYYTLRNEGNRVGRVLRVDDNGDAYMDQWVGTSAKWHMIATGWTGPEGETIYFMANQRDGASKYLEGWDGTALAHMDDAGNFTGMMFYADKYGGRYTANNPRRANESGLVYYLKTSWQGADKVLKAEWDGSSTYDVKMANRQGNIFSLWYFENYGRR